MLAERKGNTENTYDHLLEQEPVFWHLSRRKEQCISFGDYIFPQLKASEVTKVYPYESHV